MLPKGVSITLVEPRYPVNVGHVARLVENFGVEKLYLVKPKCDMSVAAIYASHASKVLDDAETTTFNAVREENQLLVATTAIRASKGSNVVRRSIGPEKLHRLLSASCPSTIVLGRDSTGLTNEEIRRCDVTVTIETRRDYRSLNVGHAAAILLYAASQGRLRVRSRDRQSRIAREVFARTLSELGHLEGSPARKDLFEVGKRIVAASSLTDTQLNLLTGVMRRAVSAIEPHQYDSKT